MTSVMASQIFYRITQSRKGLALGKELRAENVKRSAETYAM